MHYLEWNSAGLLSASRSLLDDRPMRAKHMVINLSYQMKPKIWADTMFRPYIHNNIGKFVLPTSDRSCRDSGSDIYITGAQRCTERCSGGTMDTYSLSTPYKFVQVY